MRVSRQAVSAWEVGKAMPTLLEFRELIALYGVSAERVLYGERIASAYEDLIDKIGVDGLAPSAVDG